MSADASSARRGAATAALALALSACGSNAPQAPSASASPKLGAARPGQLLACGELADRAAAQGVVYTRVVALPPGPVAVGNAQMPAPAHCLVQGHLQQRVSAVDGNTYAIGFEMRLPVEWNGRFFYQANGGLDGAVVPAIGGIGGGAPVDSALRKGFAVISSDAGHAGALGPRFGLDPQARRDYGYNAVAQLTPLARHLITQAYGRGPDRSYIGGCSNGGRHAMVAAARSTGGFDGILAGNPGFNLPRAAVAQLYGAQQYAKVATATNAAGLPELESAFTPAELKLVADRVLARCDALDGLADGIVADLQACKANFDLQRDVPTCGSDVRDGQCLSAARKTALERVFAGAQNSASKPLYSSFPFDAGIGGANWREWKFGSSQTRDPGAVAYIFTSPPLHARAGGLAFALGFDMDRDAPLIDATDGLYRESAMTFMSPPNATQLAQLRARGAKMMVYHGTSDPVFSADDTAAWYQGLQQRNGGDASGFVRYFPVPGMNHCSGGPATDQFDMLGPLVDWVEQGQAPDSVIASARGPGTAVVNPELPASWSARRTRPLCPYPLVARYQGGDAESAASFACRPPAS
ncbi:tannase/feruloyl esterase family alpha/beta hydrolase [Variovorax sp. J22P168]|uniref:tannase/feruloyl esterase family alpha/beta hydrolase n=1 Tax=Variovorax jilinensis TaxID=3053513 RepID=UPI002576EC5D|nr:tannase/feruloyl esterase family alpha/beta hydrolase [Variovorax sp. J22P168]MDM0012383.1 tannase/feruloyl esterase family alpha/beta hydrolase [Variovorax sp. J22P168]